MNIFLFRNFAIVFLAAIIAAGCSSREEIVKPDLMLSPATVMAFVNSQSALIQTFTANGSVDIQTPQIAQSAGFDLAVKKSEGSQQKPGADSIRLVIEGPFGITVGKMLLTRSTFKVYNAFSNTLYEGDTEKGLHTLPGLNGFNIELVIDAMSGVRRIEDNFIFPDSFYTINNSYILAFLTDTSKILFTVDGASLRITDVKTFSPKGTVTRKESYSYTRSKEGIWEPSRARIDIPEKSASIEIYFDDVAINPGIEALMVSFPDDADRVTIH